MGFKKTTEGRVFFQRSNRGVETGMDDGRTLARSNDDVVTDNDMFSIKDRDATLDVFNDDSALEGAPHIRRSPLTGRALKMGKPFEIQDPARRNTTNDSHDDNTTQFEIHDPTPPRTVSLGVNDSQNNDYTRAASAPSIGQDEILGLLKSLNDRLKTTKADRDRVQKQMAVYRALIEGLESKSDQAEKAYESLRGQLSGRERKAEERAAKAEKIALDTRAELDKTRALLKALDTKNRATEQTITALNTAQKKQAETFTGALKGTATNFKKETSKETAALMAVVETLQKQVTETAERQATLGTQVDDALTQQASLVRKIDKVADDRARFMRKIERIEETVLQTRDALSALGDDARDDMHMARLNTPPRHANEGADLPQALLAQSAMRFGDEAAVTSEKNKTKSDAPFWKSVLNSPLWTLLLAFILGALLIFWFSNRMQNTAVIDAQNDALVAPSDQSLVVPPVGKTNTPAFDTTLSAAPLLSPELSPAGGMPLTSDTLDVNDSAALLAAMQTDPDAVGRALNTIEPAAIPATETVNKNAPIIEKNKVVKTTPEKPTSSPVSESSLPDVIRNVEAQAMKGSPEAQHDLGAIYVAGHAGVAQDYEQAAYWFEKAANQNVANAAYNLGVLHHQGLGVKADIKNALTWYEKAAALGHPEAQYNLGIAYIEGVGVNYDAKKAAAYFKDAANEGIMEAAYNLGLIYENGLLGQTRPDDALMWYKAAADKGSAEARAAVEQLGKRLEMSPAEIEEFLKTAQKKTVESAPLGKTPVKKRIAARQNAPKTPLSPKQNQQIITAQIQEYLYAQGLFPGPADGALTPMTRDAIRTYQLRNQLSVNGAPNADVLHHMLSNES